MIRVRCLPNTNGGIGRRKTMKGNKSEVLAVRDFQQHCGSEQGTRNKLRKFSGLYALM